MTRLVMCTRLKRELPGLDTPPFPGPRGQEVFESVSADAWQDWQTLQTMLINEGQLNSLDPNTRKYLKEERDKFLANKEFDQASGYVPIESD